MQTQDKFSPTDRDTITNAVREVEQWIQEKGDTAEKEEYEVRRQLMAHLIRLTVVMGSWRSPSLGMH